MPFTTHHTDPEYANSIPWATAALPNRTALFFTVPPYVEACGDTDGMPKRGVHLGATARIAA
jgi:hypothetical protein